MKQERVGSVSRRANELKTIVLSGHSAQREVTVRERETQRCLFTLWAILTGDLHAECGWIGIGAANSFESATLVQVELLHIPIDTLLLIGYEEANEEAEAKSRLGQAVRR